LIRVHGIRREGCLNLYAPRDDYSPMPEKPSIALPGTVQHETRGLRLAVARLLHHPAQDLPAGSAEYHIGAGDTCCHVAHKRPCGAQLVERFDCGQRASSGHPAHAEIVPSWVRILQGRCWFAIPVFHRFSPFATETTGGVSSAA
jgi:hypothetical protein